MADNDPYKTLGVDKTATQDEIRRAYRAAAKKSHPDLNPGDKAAEARFKTINAANDILSDADKRARFDRGEIDAEGQPTPDRSFYRDYAAGGAASGAGPQAGSRPGAQSGPDPFARYAQGFGSDDDMFGAFFREQANQPRPGRDRTYRLDVPFLDSVNGATERLTLPDGQTLDVRIPPGITDNQVLRLRGKGDAGQRGGPDGDALIEVSVLPHPLYRRDGPDLTMEIPVSFAEAVLGARIEVPTPRGRVVLAVPPRSDAGTRLRLKGRGVAVRGDTPAGDLYAVLKLVTGPVDDALVSFLEGWPQARQPLAARDALEDAP